MYYFSLLICGWLLIREMHCFCWTRGLLVPAEEICWRFWWRDWNPQPLDYKSSTLALELNSWKASTAKESSLSRWSILSFFLFIILHPRSVLFLLDAETHGTSRGETLRMLKERLEPIKPRLQWIYNPSIIMMQYSIWLNLTLSQH